MPTHRHLYAPTHAGRIILMVAGLFLLSACKQAPTPAPPTASPAPVMLPTLTAVEPTPEPPLAERLAVELPPRDRADLARRFLGWGGTISPPPADYQVGDVESFWVSNTEADELLSVDAQLIYRGEHVYIWIEEGQAFDVDAYVAAAKRFDTHIYPTTREHFGSEPLPGVDGDPRVHILHSTALSSNASGYFYSPSEYPSAVVPYSNQKEMFFINLNYLAPTSDAYDSTLAHEFQHMIHWNADTNEDIWLNEGLAELSSLVNGYGPSSFTLFFMREPDLQLNTWPSGTRRPHYGAAFLFSAYWRDRFGDEAVRALIAHTGNGLDGVDATLRDLGERITADDLFADWVIANLLNDLDVGDGRYGYRSMATMPPPGYANDEGEIGEEYRGTVHQYGTDYLRIEEGGVEVAFSGEREVRIIPTNTQNTDGDSSTEDRFVWWSNRGDNADTTLTRVIDLRGVSSATLTYDVWFAIEQWWDFAYVTVSVDGGQTWEMLSTAHTTPENPNGTSYGPGYTGQSAESGDADAEGWISEEIDLRAYVGGEILLRFEMITDDGVNLPGLAVDNVCLVELGWCDNAESPDGGWQSQGFVRHDNVIPQTFVVQVVTFDEVGTPQIGLVALSEDNTADITLPANRDYPPVLVISGLTRHTTEVAFYSLALDSLETSDD